MESIVYTLFLMLLLALLVINSATLATFIIAQAIFDTAATAASPIASIVVIDAVAIDITPDYIMPHARSTKQIYKQYKNN